MIDLERHPFAVIRNIKSQFFLDDAEFEYSRYVSGGRGRTISREICKVKGSELSTKWFLKELSLLKAGEELAWHSSVYRLGARFHIPMVDFQGIYQENKFKPLVQNLLKRVKGNAYIFDSGRSSHGYMLSLLTEEEWYFYLGLLLLSNPFSSSEPQIVDSRWVGHSLKQGFSALRWSKNTELYLQVPFLKEIFEK